MNGRYHVEFTVKKVLREELIGQETILDGCGKEVPWVTSRLRTNKRPSGLIVGDLTFELFRSGLTYKNVREGGDGTTLRRWMVLHTGCQVGLFLDDYLLCPVTDMYPGSPGRPCSAEGTK